MAKTASAAAPSPTPATSSYPDPPSDDEARAVALYLGEALEIYKKAWKLEHKRAIVNFDPVVVVSIARSVLDDIWRYEVYHIGADQTTRANAVKRAGYLTKWICRFRPLFFQRGSGASPFKANYEPKKDDSLFINEAFAIHLAMQTMATELNKADIALAPAFYDRFIYDLHFRHFHDDAILEVYDIVADRVRRRDIIIR